MCCVLQQQPRFISLRPPPGLNGSSIDSPSLAFPRGTTAEQMETLSKFASHGYTPQGVPLPNAKTQQAEESGVTYQELQRADAEEIMGYGIHTSFAWGRGAAERPVVDSLEHR